MSENTSASPRVVKVAAGIESTAGPVPVRDARHEDVYEWAPGGFFVVHSGP
jgi:hypothetical protein